MPTHPGPPAAATGDDDLADLLARSGFAVMRVLTKLAAENDLSLTQLRVLGILRDRRVPISALASHLGLDKSTLTGLVSRAEKRGLLQRAPNATDRRSVDVFLTAEGRLFAERLTGEFAARLAPHTAALSPAEQAGLRTLLTKLIDP